MADNIRTKLTGILYVANSPHKLYYEYQPWLLVAILMTTTKTESM